MVFRETENGTEEVRKWIFLRTDRILTENGKMDRLYYTENVFAIPSLSQYILTCKFDESRKRLDFLISSSLSMFVIIFTTRLVDSKGLQAKQRLTLVVKDILLLFASHAGTLLGLLGRSSEVHFLAELFSQVTVVVQNGNSVK